MYTKRVENTWPGERQRHVVPAGAGGERLDRYAAAVLARLPSTAAARKAARRGEIWLNGAPAESSRFVRSGDVIEHRPGPSHPPPPVAMDLACPWCDDRLLVVVKPPGIHVSGARARTLEGALAARFGPSGAHDALPWPRPVHRLDRRTGGLVVAARSAAAASSLGRQFEAHRVHKRYRALLVGALDGEGEVDAPVEGRWARTRWRAVARTRALRGGWVTTVDVWPLTGRTHQIRRHMAALGHPVLGDDLYGLPGLVLRRKGLFLWALEIGIDHPRDGRRLRVTIDEPARFGAFRRREERRWSRWRGEG